MEPLNLAGADTTSYEDAVDPGAYHAEVVRAEWKETKGGENAKMPAGSPLLNIGFKITDEPWEGRWVWRSYAIPTKEYEKANKDKAAKLKGGLVRFLVALGFDEAEVTGGSFDLSDPTILEDRECVVSVSRREYPKDSGNYTNDVKGVKPADSPVAATSSSLL